MRREHPRQVHRIGNPGIHPIAGVRHPDVRGVTGDKYAPAAERVGHQAAAEPILARDDFVAELRADAEDRADARVAIDRLEIAVVGPEIIENHPALAAIDRYYVSRTIRVHRIGNPGGRAALHAEQVGRANERRLHAHDDGVALELRTDTVAHDRPRAVAPHEV